MRCPKCKTELIKGKRKRYETLEEHVLDPNKSNYPLRPTFVCPNNCLGKDSYFDFDGSLCSDGKNIIPSNCFSALDSMDRKNNIKVDLTRLSTNFLYHARSLSLLIIDGEKDIPPKWKWPFYALRGKILNICYKWKHRNKKDDKLFFSKTPNF